MRAALISTPRTRLATSAVGAPAADSAPADPVQRLAQSIRQAFCGLLGHNQVLLFGPDRLSLRCVDCGQETPGWTIGGPPLPDSRRR